MHHSLLKHFLSSAPVTPPTLLVFVPMALDTPFWFLLLALILYLPFKLRAALRLPSAPSPSLVPRSLQIISSGSLPSCNVDMTVVSSTCLSLTSFQNSRFPWFSSCLTFPHGCHGGISNSTYLKRSPRVPFLQRLLCHQALSSTLFIEPKI